MVCYEKNKASFYSKISYRRLNQCWIRGIYFRGENKEFLKYWKNENELKKRRKKRGKKEKKKTEKREEKGKNHKKGGKG